MPISTGTLLNAVLRPPTGYRALTLTGGVQTDATRLANTQGDGLSIPSGDGVWPAATNLVTNGGFETNTTGWGASTGTPTLGRVTSDFKFGTAALAITLTATEGRAAGNNSASVFTAGTVYSLSAWIKAGNAAAVGRTAGVRLNEQGGVHPGAAMFTSTITLTTSWQRVSGSGAIVEADRTSVGVFCGIIGTVGQIGDVVLADGVQLELGSIATPYIQTDGGDASRTAGRVTIPTAGLFTATQGAVCMRAVLGYASASQPNSGPRMINIGGGSDTLQLFFNGVNLTMRSQVSGGAAAVDATSAISFSAQAHQTLAGAWTATSVYAIANATAGGTAVRSEIPTIATDGDLFNRSDLARSLSGQALWLLTMKGVPVNADYIVMNAWGDPVPTLSQIAQLSPASKPTALVTFGPSGTDVTLLPGYFS